MQRPAVTSVVEGERFIHGREGYGDVCEGERKFEVERKMDY